MTFYLIYSSHPCGEGHPDSLEEITQTSVRNNLTKGITGMLLALENKYIQYLEGDQADILHLMEKIKKDPRHEQLTVWLQGFTEKRVFTDWSMASWLLSNKLLNELSALDDLRRFVMNPHIASGQSQKFICMMNELLKTWLIHEEERLKKLQE